MLDISHIIALLEASKYPIIFVGSFFEGSIVMMGVGALYHAGSVSLVPAFLALLLGDISADIMWYYVGKFGGRKAALRWGHLLNATPEVLEHVSLRFNRHASTILLVSKVTSGLGFAYATLMTAGMLRVPILKFVVINILGGVMWVSGMMTLGYFFGNFLELLPKEAHIAAAIVGIGIALMGLRFMSSYLSRVKW